MQIRDIETSFELQILCKKKANTRRIDIDSVDSSRQLAASIFPRYVVTRSTVYSSKLGRLASFRLIVGVRKKKRKERNERGKRERKSAEQRTRREKKEEKEEKGEVTTRKRETTLFCKCTA